MCITGCKSSGGPTPGPSGGCTPCTITSETVSTARADRHRTRVGIGERVTLTAAPSGTYTWSVSGGGTLSATSGNAIVFTAGDRAASGTITATNGSCTCTITLTVVEPNGAHQVQFGATLHTNGHASAGFRGITYLEPADVSFENIEVNEGNCNGVGTGFWASSTGDVHPAWPAWATVAGGSDATGSFVQGPNQTGPTYWDCVSTDAGAGPWTVGTFLWPIPWEFRVNGGPKKAFTTLNHQETLAGPSGQVTMSKGGVSVTAMPADPTETP
jgi:hypothetical protein